MKRNKCSPIKLHWNCCVCNNREEEEEEEEEKKNFEMILF